MHKKPAGWYRNSTDRRQHDYWDGESWVDLGDVGPVEEARKPHEGDTLELAGGTTVQVVGLTETVNDGLTQTVRVATPGSD